MKVKNDIAMNTEQLQEVLEWLKSQISYANATINEAHETHNFGREVQYEGMRDAFMRCLNKLSH